jgi:hypothetical protein
MIDATTPAGMTRLFVLLETGSDCWRVISMSVWRQFYADAVTLVSDFHPLAAE